MRDGGLYLRDLQELAGLTLGELSEVLVLRPVPQRTLLLSLLPHMYAGTHMGRPALQHMRGRDVEVHAARLPLEVDGEQPGTTDVRIRVLPQALRVRVPSGN